MADSGQKKKSLPKRTGKDSKQRRMAASLRRGADRKQKRQKEQQRREKANRQLREQDLPTAWERARFESQARHLSRAVQTTAPRTLDGNIITGVDAQGIVCVRGWSFAKCLAVTQRGYVRLEERGRQQWNP